MKIKDVLFTFLTVSDIMVGAILTEEVTHPFYEFRFPS